MQKPERWITRLTRAALSQLAPLKAADITLNSVVVSSDVFNSSRNPLIFKTPSHRIKCVPYHGEFHDPSTKTQKQLQ